MARKRSMNGSREATTPTNAQRKILRRSERAFDAGLLLGTVVVVFVVLVIAQNGERARFDILWWAWTTRLWSALIAAAFFGLVIGLTLPAAARRRRALKRERRLALVAIDDSDVKS